MPRTLAKPAPIAAQTRPTDDRDRCVLFDIQRANRAITVLYNARMRDSGLTIAQFSLLRTIAALAPARMASIADSMLMDRTSVTRLIAPLLDRGYLKIAEDPEDKRAKAVTVTPGGRKALKASEAAWHAAQQELRSIVGASNVAQLRTLSREVARLVGDSERCKA